MEKLRKPGDILEERYVIRRILGKGGSGTVYLAWDRRIHRWRAIKETKDKNQEMEMLRQLHHKHLIEIFDAFEEEGFRYLVIEYVEGCSVAQKLERGVVFSKEQVIGYGIQICETLCYLHEQIPPVIYGDIKPSNLMLEQDGTIKLIDLGTAKTFTGSEERKLWGTQRYAPPEREEGQEDVRGDIYSLGVTMYEMVHGKHFMVDALKENGTAFDAVCKKCTAKMPKERYQTAYAVIQALKSCDRREEEEEKRRKRQGTIAVIFLGLSVALAVCADSLECEAQRLMDDGYVRYLEAGSKSQEAKIREENFLQAIKCRPEAGAGYEALLDEYVQQGFRAEQYEKILEVLEMEGEDGKNLEDCLKETPEDYAVFCSQMGQACFFSWEGYGNKRQARPWLQLALESGYRKEEEEMLRMLLKISEYYEKLGQQMEEGIEDVSYKEFWDDLCALEKMKTEHETKESIQKEVVSQILQHAGDFYQSGISVTEMEKHLEKQRNGEKVLEEMIEQGKTILNVLELPGERKGE